MKEKHLYSVSLLTGILILLGGIIWHSWLAVASGALLAGIGGVFGTVAHKAETERSDDKDQQ